MGADESKLHSVFKENKRKEYNYSNEAKIRQNEPQTINNHIIAGDSVMTKRAATDQPTKRREGELERHHRHRNHANLKEPIKSREVKSRDRELQRRKKKSRSHSSDEENHRERRKKSPQNGEQAISKHRQDSAQNISKETVHEGKPATDQRERRKTRPNDKNKGKRRDKKEMKPPPRLKSEENSTDDEKKVSSGSHQVRRRKRKADSSKHKKIHKSAPDLTMEDHSKVGAWLNSSSFYWPQENLQSAYSFPYATLPAVYGHTPMDDMSQPRPIVDGMGSPLGTVYPDGTFLPDGATSSLNGTWRYKPTSPLQYGVSPFYPFSYPYQYYVPPQFYTSKHLSTIDVRKNKRSQAYGKLGGRSRSHNHIDHMIHNDDDYDNYGVSTLDENHENKSEQTSPRSAPPLDGRGSLHGSGSSSLHPPKGEYYSDIAETRDSLQHAFNYRANQQIAVDKVKHVSVSYGKSPDVSDSNSIVSADTDDESSLNDSSCNDVELDAHDMTKLEEAVKRKSAARVQAGALKVFKPLSKREVFIDESPDKAAEISADVSEDRKTINKQPKAPMMTLCEKESIVATSFFVDGGKVFCLKSVRIASPAPSNAIQHKNDNRCSNTDPGDNSALLEIPTKEKTARESFVPDVESGRMFIFTGSPPSLDHAEDPNSNKKSKNEAAIKDTAISVKNVSTSEKELSEGRLFSSFPSSLKFQNHSVNSEKNNFEEMWKARIAHGPVTHGPVTRGPITHGPVTGNEESISQHVYENVFQSVSKTTREYINDSSDSEPLMREDPHSITKKLIRIDSHDSFTMKRRWRPHRRSSSHSEKADLAPFRRRATVGSLSQNDVSAGDDMSCDLQRHSYHSPSSTSASLNPFKRQNSPDIAPLLYRAKSEEALRREMSKSTEALMSDLSPRQKKETLQERAARILGLTTSDLSKAKAKHSANTWDSEPLSSTTRHSVTNSSLTTVTPTSSAKGTIFHPSLESSNSSTRISRNDLRVKGGFISTGVAELKSDGSANKYKVVESLSSSNSCEDVSTISLDSMTSRSSRSSTPLVDGDFMIEVSDSVLEDTSVHCKVKPHKENLYLTSAKEYKIPDNIVVSSQSATMIPHDVVLSPSSAQASIVASYADSIYDRTPLSSAGHQHELSDDTTETESLDQSGRFNDSLAATVNKPLSKNSPHVKDTFTRYGDSSAPMHKSTSAVEDERRAQLSPVPVASHSAPLTSGELDIVMQLYNSADESASTSSYDVTEKAIIPSNSANRNALRKEKIAKAIGFNPQNIDRGTKNRRLEKNASMEKIENLEIKVFPGSALVRCSNIAEKSNEMPQYQLTTDTAVTAEDGVVEVMQSLGLDPDDAWMVSI